MKDNTILYIIDKPIILIGMMGTGKTTIGKILAQHLACPFIDIDQKVEEKIQMSILNFFYHKGENNFRQKEAEALSETLQKHKTNSLSVLAAGGGIVTHTQSFEQIQKKTFSIWLKTSIENLFERIKTENHRPLLQTSEYKTEKEQKKILNQILVQRQHLYQQANLIIDTNNTLPENVVKSILKKIRLQKKIP